MNGQTSCGLLDAVAYLVSYLPSGGKYGVSGYYGYYSSEAANMAYKTGWSLGYGASAFNDKGSCYSDIEICRRRRLSETGNRRLEQADSAATGIEYTVSVLSRFIADLKSPTGFGGGTDC